MNQIEQINIIWAIGALVITVGALSGHKLGWRKGFVYALIWAAIFCVLGFLFTTLGFE